MRAPTSSDWKGQARAWPVLAGIALAVAGIGLSAASVFISEKVRTNAAMAEQLRGRFQGKPLQPTPASLRAVPAWSQRSFHLHLDDVGELGRTAQRHHLQLGHAAYRTKHQRALGIAVRMLDLQVEAEYPHLKAFVADLLQTMPHAYLDEIRIEQTGSPGTTRIKATLKMAFVYSRPAQHSPQTELTGSSP